jgi:hypothetical protein
LGVSKGASKEDIKKAYRTLAMEYVCVLLSPPLSRPSFLNYPGTIQTVTVGTRKRKKTLSVSRKHTAYYPIKTSGKNMIWECTMEGERRVDGEDGRGVGQEGEEGEGEEGESGGGLGGSMGLMGSSLSLTFRRSCKIFYV